MLASSITCHMIGRIILGLAMIGVGFIFVWKTEIPFRLIGYIPTAERIFMGGSRFFYKLLGLLIIFIGALVVAGLQDDFIAVTLGSLLTGGRK